MSNTEIHPLTVKLLKNRSVVGNDNIEKFLNPSYEKDVFDPFLIYGMEKAVKRIIKAVKNEEVVAIYSDYDCDGVPGGVLLRDFFDTIGYKKVIIYIPHRHNEGYGLHKHAIDKLKAEKVTLMITVDSGITNLEEIEYAEGLGINVIVTDHHLPLEGCKVKGEGFSNIKIQILPKAYCVLNSKQDKCEYPDDMLCGCAVAWKLACAVLVSLRGEITIQGDSKEESDKKKGTKVKIPKSIDVILKTVSELPEGYEKWWLDLVAISTIADMVPLVNENRVLAHFGLKVLQKTKRIGLKNVFYNNGVSLDKINEEDIAFTIAPRINAAGRMGHPIQAHNMLYEKNMERSEEYVAEIEILNNQRKGDVKDVMSTISFDHSVYQEDVIVVGDESWSPGILGLIAQAIIEETGKPTFVWGMGGEIGHRVQGEGFSEHQNSILKGSCRSRGDVHVVDLMREVGDVLLGFGGHEQAGGFSLLLENKDKLQKALSDALKRVEIKEIKSSDVVAEAELSFSDVNNMTHEAISVLAPFGIGNSKPVFSFPKTKALSVRWFGKQNEHIEVLYADGFKQIKAIKFFADKDLEEKLKKEHVLLAHFEKSYWRGKGESWLRIVGIVESS